jgi:hypothetical protein
MSEFKSKSQMRREAIQKGTVDEFHLNELKKCAENKFKKIIKFTPAFDERNDDPSKNYGIGSMTIRFVFQGAKGATQFLISTGMLLKHVQEEFNKKGWTSNWMGYDVGYHSPKPIFDGQEPISTDGSCSYVEGQNCYYDGSTLQAEKLAEQFVSTGEDVIWEELNRLYNLYFGED